MALWKRIQNHGSFESLSLEKIFKTIQSNHQHITNIVSDFSELITVVNTVIIDEIEQLLEKLTVSI